MGQRHIFEGTSRELTPYLAQYPNRRFRLVELADEATDISEPPVNTGGSTFTPPPAPTYKIVPLSPEEAKIKNAPLVALLEKQLAEAEEWRANATPEELAEADAEWQEFMDALDSERRRAGMRLLSPSE